MDELREGLKKSMSEPMKAKSQHTRTPWQVDKQGRICSHIEPMYQPCKNYSMVNPSQITEGDAAFIVRAVNTHEELLEALKDQHDEVKTATGYHDSTYCEVCELIAKAEGRE